MPASAETPVADFSPLEADGAGEVPIVDRESAAWATSLLLHLSILVLLAVTLALERQSWLRWIFFGVMEFLVMYSWPGAAYPLVFMNLVLVVILLRRRDRWMHVTRWFTVSAAAGTLFVSLYAPHLPQIKQYNLTHLWMKGMPMDAIWLHNVMASPSPACRR